MNRQTIYILILITIVLVLVVSYPAFKSHLGISGRDAVDTEIDLSNLSTDGINKIVIKKGEDEKVLSKSGSGWQINNLPAAAKDVEDFIKKIEQVKINRLVSKNRENHAQFGVDEKEGYSLGLYKGDVLGMSLFIGREAAGFHTFYVRKKDSDHVYSAFGEIDQYMSRSADDWKDKGNDKDKSKDKGEGK